MGIHAYDEIYLSSAQNILGHAVDFAVMSLSIEPDVFGKALAVSKSAKQFAQGNPRYVAGVNGPELVREILDDARISYPAVPDAMYLDKSPEYWAGWALAFYQWLEDISFMEILQTVSLDQIIAMYPVYHEMDVMKFAEQLNQQRKAAHPHTRLREYRGNVGLSQECRCGKSSFSSRGKGISPRRLRLQCTDSPRRFIAGWRTCWPKWAL